MGYLVRGECGMYSTVLWVPTCFGSHEVNIVCSPRRFPLIMTTALYAIGFRPAHLSVFQPASITLDVWWVVVVARGFFSSSLCRLSRNAGFRPCSMIPGGGA